MRGGWLVALFAALLLSQAAGAAQSPVPDTKAPVLLTADTITYD